MSWETCRTGNSSYSWLSLSAIGLYTRISGYYLTEKVEHQGQEFISDLKVGQGTGGQELLIEFDVGVNFRRRIGRIITYDNYSNWHPTGVIVTCLMCCLKIGTWSVFLVYVANTTLYVGRNKRRRVASRVRTPTSRACDYLRMRCHECGGNSVYVLVS